MVIHMKIGVLGGIHEDIVRLREALALLDRQGCALLVSLGDIVGYSVPYYGYQDERDAHACIQLVKARRRHSLIGNHDLFAIRKIPRHSQFAYPAGWYALDLVAQRSVSRDAVWLYESDLVANLDRDDIAYLDALPEFVAARFDQAAVLFSHYAFPNLVGDGVVSDPADDAGRAHFAFMARHGCDLAVFDHDLCDGVRLFSVDGMQEFGFGTHALPRGPVAFNGPWVANGTSPNGVLVLDLARREVHALPLNTPVHRVAG
jgi:hypothetical protein